MKNMRVTQNYNGITSHRPHWYNTKDYKDYPIDDGGIDSSKEGIYCPCDEMLVTAVKGVGNTATNTIWLVSTSKVKTPTFEDYAFMTLTHSNDENFKNIVVNKTKYKRGELIIKEGNDGADAIHIHMTFGKGSSNNWIQNSNGKWVMTGDTKKPEEVCYVDDNFTKIYNNGGINWIHLIKEIGNPVARDESVDQIEILVDNLRVRTTTAIADDNIAGYIKKGIYNVLEIGADNNYIWYKVDNNLWIAYSASWANVFPKKETEQNGDDGNEEIPDIDDDLDNKDKPSNIIDKIISFIKKVFDFLIGNK